MGWAIDMPPTMATGVRLGPDIPVGAILICAKLIWLVWPWAGAGAMGWMVLGLFMRGGFGDGGVDPRSSPELTKALKGRPRHLMLERYFLALLPDFSSNSLGVSHSSPSRMHFPFDPDSYLLTYR